MGEIALLLLLKLSDAQLDMRHVAALHETACPALLPS
jgi:hypothetical protein